MILILQKEEDRTKKRCVKGTDSDEGWTRTHAGVRAGKMRAGKLFFIITGHQ